MYQHIIISSHQGLFGLPTHRMFYFNLVSYHACFVEKIDMIHQIPLTYVDMRNIVRNKIYVCKVKQ